ncbi:hypothetical protein [Streptomyces sp. OM5714]|uniref:hypothetical protein n=1 Tax=Streptomyces sp. OM5714 TaxID=2602736 RepID=UPI0013DBB317|nr:hypothetical protein [Streptomyces sp. OM5714]KAF2774664.1 hypothetical protein STPH1_7709 [Streptomyces sp. OM5714]
MTDRLTSQQLTDIEARANAATPGPWEHYTQYGPTFFANTTGPYLQGVGDLNFGEGEQARADEEFVVHAPEDVRALLAEVRRLQDELAEEQAGRNPLLRCLIVKSARDKDQYVGWSNVAEGPTGVWSRETALAYGFPASRLDRADENGSSDLSCGDGHWDDKGFVAEQRGWLHRDRLGDYAVEYLHGDRQAAYALLEPFEDETSA